MTTNTTAKNAESRRALSARPLLKWAGGKTQLLGEILPKAPQKYGKYIEPFLGGGAVFFALKPKSSVISDSNPELMNLYAQVASHVDEVIRCLHRYKNSKDIFYAVREQNWKELPKPEAAARTIFLNHTCYNGLYRVNRQGHFNVPYGKYKNPKICDEEALYAASDALKGAVIVCADYLQVLEHYAQPGDFIFLDPPYLPVSTYSDFKRYTKEQFYEEDHRALAKEVKRLHELGCYVILMNSNHPLVHELYSDYPVEVVPTKRYISCKGNSRCGEDVIVSIPPKRRLQVHFVPEPLAEQVSRFPATRFMGSKSKLLPEIWKVASQFQFHTAADLFSGSGIVGYLFKAQGKAVISNDYMAMSAVFAKAMIENSSVTLPLDEAKILLSPKYENDHFVSRTFDGLYYSKTDNELIDILRANIAHIKGPYKRAIAMSALIRACLKKRPRGIFTYTGNRYDDGRKDLKKSLEEQFLEAVAAVNRSVFDNGQTNRAKNCDAIALRIPTPDLVYIDPPYYSPLSDNEYVRRYHFVEGLARDWKGVEIQQNTQTKKFKSYPTPFSTRKGAENAFELLFKKYAKSIQIVSYSSNGLPTKDEMLALMAKYKAHVEVIPVNYRYSFGNQGTKVNDNRNKVQEYLFIGY
ncbi:MAG: Dam family site-specific DNA-(adenine-N6)-methyltransferase [Oscillospiraceae bacterium]|jgi:DNA adenine methylase|nr:Dam family site-specific DNA-(adenine-N6)-methyltransferase [Oscillospiraceae bacterium]